MSRSLFFVALAILFAVSSCTNHAARSNKEELVAAVIAADKIVVTEHSDESDFSDRVKRSGSAKLPFYEYGRYEMDPAAKAELVESLKGMDDQTQDAVLQCFFVAHHRMQLYSGGKLQSTMEICFKCRAAIWDGSKRAPPWGLLNVLEATIKKCGFEPKRDWGALAEQHAKPPAP